MSKSIWSTALLALICILVNCAEAEESFRLSNSNSTIQLHVVRFDANENSGFELVDGGRKQRRYSVRQHFDPEQHLLIINGGYFDGSMNPVGVCKVGGRVISAKNSDRLSGYILLNDSGQLDLVERLEPSEIPDSVLQSGPFIIDPGSSVGIHSETGLPAKRTIVAVTDDEQVLIITTSEVTLYRLARFLHEKLPEIDRALNLDGGPSTALIYKDIKIENRNPVRNFLRKKRAPVASL